MFQKILRQFLLKNFAFHNYFIDKKKKVLNAYFFHLQFKKFKSLLPRPINLSNSSFSHFQITRVDMKLNERRISSSSKYANKRFFFFCGRKSRRNTRNSGCRIRTWHVRLIYRVIITGLPLVFSSLIMQKRSFIFLDRYDGKVFRLARQTRLSPN